MFGAAVKLKMRAVNLTGSVAFGESVHVVMTKNGSETKERNVLKKHIPLIACPLLLVFVVSWSLLLTGCGKKEAVAAEARQEVSPPKLQTKEPEPVTAAQPVVAAAAESSADNRRMTAIFSANHADKTLNDKLPSLEDYISSRITEKGFSVISREVATVAVSALLKDSKQTEIDKILDNNASVLRLAQMLGANYILMVSISSYGTDKETTEAYGVKTVSVAHNLRVTYKILDGGQGGTLAGDTFKVSSIKKFTENKRSESTGIVDDLLDQASVKIAESAGTKVIKTVIVSSKLAEFSIACGMQDLAQLPTSIADIRLTENNTVVIGKERIPVLALNVMVELDGAGIGSTPATFKVPPGLHKLRLRRDGFNDFEGTISVYQGQRFNVGLQMTDAGYQRWKDNTAFLNSIEIGKKLTDAEAEKIKGEARRLQQSGYKVDIKVDSKEDTRVDTKEGLKIYKSIF